MRTIYTAEKKEINAQKHIKNIQKICRKIYSENKRGRI